MDEHGFWQCDDNKQVREAIEAHLAAKLHVSTLTKAKDELVGWIQQWQSSIATDGGSWPFVRCTPGFPQTHQRVTPDSCGLLL